MRLHIYLIQNTSHFSTEFIQGYNNRHRTTPLLTSNGADVREREPLFIGCYRQYEWMSQQGTWE